MSELYVMMKAIVEKAVETTVMSRDDFKKFLTATNHKGLGELLMSLELEITNHEYTTLTHWETNAIKSYSYVYQQNGRFATAKIAHNVRILLMQQYTLVMTAMTREHIANNIIAK